MTSATDQLSRAAAEVGAGFSPEQQGYLEGFFAGVRSTGVGFADLAAAPSAAAAAPDAGPAWDDLTREERIKREVLPAAWCAAINCGSWHRSRAI